MRALRADPLTFFWGALLLLTIPASWLCAALLAAAVHELCHLACLWAVGGQVFSLRLGAGGARMETGPVSPGRELVCALAGPAGSLLLVCLSRWIPRTALCGLIHGLYNLLPVYPLDGGRILRCGLLLLGKGPGEGFVIWAERICLVGIFLLSAAAAFWLRLGIFPILAAIALIIRAMARKIPCKPGRLGVQ